MAAWQEVMDINVKGTLLCCRAVAEEMIRQGDPGDSVTRARRHFERALELTSGTLASPYLAWAEAVSVPRQDRAEFEQMLNLALEVDINKFPARRLENLAMQDKADWLLNRVDRYIAD